MCFFKKQSREKGGKNESRGAQRRGFGSPSCVGLGLHGARAFPGRLGLSTPLAAARGREGGRTRSGAPHNGLASAFFDLLIMLGWNSVWRRACLVRWSLRMKRFSHSGQRNCFSPVWVR